MNTYEVDGECRCGHPLAEHYASGCGWCICKVAGPAVDKEGSS